MTITFPPELVERFVFELAAQGGHLSPLLFVSRASCHAARRAIFRTIELHYEPAANWITRKFSSERLLNALQGNEQLLGLVQEVTITFQTAAGGHFLDRNPKEERVWSYDEWQSGAADEDEPFPDPAFAPLLQLLAKCPINTLTLRSMASGRQYRHFDMAHFPPSTIGDLLSLRCCPTLRRLTLDNLAAMPVLLVTGNPATDRVEYLNMARYPMSIRHGSRTLAPFEKDIEALPPCLSGAMADKTVPFQSLEELNMSDPGCFPLFICRTIPEAFALEDKLVAALASPEAEDEDFSDSEFEDPSKSFTFPSLKTFRMGVRDINPQDILIVATILEHAPNLDTMVVEDDLLGRESTVMDKFMARALVGLARTSGTVRSLRIKHLGKAVSNRTFGEIKAISALLGPLAPVLQEPDNKNVVETITIEVEWSGEEIAEEKSLRRICNMRNGWHDMKMALGSFPKLENLVLNLSVAESEFCPDEDERGLFEDLVKGLAAELSLRGKVKVDYSLSMREVDWDDADSEEMGGEEASCFEDW